jgi:hypothetical protein
MTIEKTVAIRKLPHITLPMVDTRVLSAYHTSTIVAVHKCIREITIVTDVLFALNTKASDTSTALWIAKLALPTQSFVTILNHTG